MHEQLVGVVDSIFTKDITIKNGPRAGQTSKVYHAMIDGHDVNLGFETALQEGQKVTLPVEEKFGGLSLSRETLNPSAPFVGAANDNTTGANAKSSKPAFPIPNNTKDTSIIRQSSLNRAIESVHQLMERGLIVISSEAEYQNKVLEYAYFYTDFGTGQREMKAAAAQAAYEAD